MPTLSDKILKGLQFKEGVLQSYNTQEKSVTTNQLGESKMNDSNIATINANPTTEETIEQLRASIKDKDAALENANAEMEKLKTTKNAALKAKREAEAKVKDLTAEAVSLKSDLESASTVEIDTSGAQSKIDSALKTLHTINQLNEMSGGRGDFTKDQMQLVIRDLIGEAPENTLLIAN